VIDIVVIVCSVLTILVIVALLQMFLYNKIFNTLVPAMYNKQMIPIFGIFYSLYLRKVYGVHKGSVLVELHGELLWYKDTIGVTR
jgi:uncharacterized protein YhhL (DUF1145 family)